MTAHVPARWRTPVGTVVNGETRRWFWRDPTGADLRRHLAGAAMAGTVAPLILAIVAKQISRP